MGRNPHPWHTHVNTVTLIVPRTLPSNSGSVATNAMASQLTQGHTTSGYVTVTVTFPAWCAGSEKQGGACKCK
jgi:hypothetical protein